MHRKSERSENVCLTHTRLTIYYIRPLLYDSKSLLLNDIVTEPLRNVIEPLRFALDNTLLIHQLYILVEIRRHKGMAESSILCLGCRTIFYTCYSTILQ